MTDIEKFVTPESMLTPGLAGGMTMGITNALAFQFALNAPQPALIALVLSFVFGLCVFVSGKPGKRAFKLLFWVVNSLVIFTVAAGSNSLGTAAVSAQAQAAPSSAARVVIENLLPSAHAQTELKWCCLDGSAKPLAAAQCTQKNGKAAETQAEAEQTCEAARAESPAHQKTKRAFFQSWLRPTPQPKP